MTTIVCGKIRVISPKKWNNGSIELVHNMALFGRPSYGGESQIKYNYKELVMKWPRKINWNPL